jgi:glutamate/tyrosine decarboxylase-like PLP-dependent enzyme
VEDRFFGLITGGTTPASIVGDFLATLYDLNVCLHVPKETIATSVEHLALDMVLDLCNIPREAYPGKLLTTGATASNTIGMLLGRQWVGKKRWNIDIAEDGFCGKVIKVIGGSVHSSVVKAVGVAGIGRRNYIDVSLDQEGRKWDLTKLEDILKHQKAGTTEGSIVVVGCGEVGVLKHIIEPHRI